MNKIDPFFAIDLFKSLNSVILLIIFVTIISAVVLSGIYKSQKKPIKKIWIIAGAVTGLSILILVISSILVTMSVYNNIN